MRFYKGYKLDDVADEKAITFFILLNEAYKLDAIEQMKAIVIADMPNAEEKDRRRVFEQLQRVSSDIIELGENNDYSGLDTLKREF